MNSRCFATRHAWFALFAFLVAAPAGAHFQLIYTPEPALKVGGPLQMLLVFTHPFEAGHTMDMAMPAEFYVVSQRGKEARPQRTDLKKHLQEIQWTSLTNVGRAYEAQLPKGIVRSLGDYVFVLVPTPYYEGSEEKFIQQFTKMVLNVGGLPGNWADPVGLPAEIVPLNKPYANWVGGVFSGVVLADGKPAPHAELEIGYVNHEPNLSQRRFEPQARASAPQDSFVNLSIRTNDRGEFTIGLPKAGWWGICALGVGPQSQYQGKPLSQDAVLWVKATDMQ